MRAACSSSSLDFGPSFSKRLPRALELVPPEPGQRLVRIGSELRLGVLEAVEQREVALVVERRDRRRPRLLVLVLERCDEARERLPLVPELGDLAADVLEEDVQVARAGPSADPSQPSSARSSSAHSSSSSGRAARRNARARRVATRIWCRSSGSVPSRVPGIVREEAVVLLRERRPGARRPEERPSGSCALLRRIGEIEDAVQLRLEVARLRSRLAERLLEPAQRLLVAVEQLDLELAEARGHPLAVEHRDRVVHDLGAVRAHDLAPRPQARDAHELRPAQVGDAGGRAAPSAAGRAGRRFSSSMRAAPRGSFSCQRPVPFSSRCRKVTPWRASRRSGVSWYVETKARDRKRRAELREPEALSRNELQLALDVLAHPTQLSGPRTTKGGPEAAPRVGHRGGGPSPASRPPPRAGSSSARA